MALQCAVEMAAKAHLGMWCEGESALPYLSHPMEVMHLLRHIGGVTETEMLCAAILHDTVETDALTLQKIEKALGQRVAGLVRELTRSEPAPEQVVNLSRDDIWQLRADMLVDEISKMSADAQQIKLADRLANVRDAHRTKSGKKLRRYLVQTKKILEVVPRNRNKALWDAIHSELE